MATPSTSLRVYLGHWLSFQSVMLRMRFRHLRRSWRYATYTLSPDDARVMMLGCRRPAGWYPLTVLTVEEAFESAQKIFFEHDQLPRLVAQACAKVGRNWTPTGNERILAIRWAIEAAEERAASEGISLVRRDSRTEIADYAP